MIINEELDLVHQHFVIVAINKVIQNLIFGIINDLKIEIYNLITLLIYKIINDNLEKIIEKLEIKIQLFENLEKLIIIYISINEYKNVHQNFIVKIKFENNEIQNEHNELIQVQNELNVMEHIGLETNLIVYLTDH